MNDSLLAVFKNLLTDVRNYIQSIDLKNIQLLKQAKFESLRVKGLDLDNITDCSDSDAIFRFSVLRDDIAFQLGIFRNQIAQSSTED